MRHVDHLLGTAGVALVEDGAVLDLVLLRRQPNNHIISTKTINNKIRIRSSWTAEEKKNETNGGIYEDYSKATGVRKTCVPTALQTAKLQQKHARII